MIPSLDAAQSRDPGPGGGAQDVSFSTNVPRSADTIGVASLAGAPRTWFTVGMRPLPTTLRVALRLAVALGLLAALPAAAQVRPTPAPPPPAAEPGPAFSTRLALGAASLAYTNAGGDRAARAGVAVEYRVRYRQTPRFGVDYTLTWGLTDWDRAREWIDAGNSAGAWTTERIQAVGDWAVEDENTAGLRLLGAVFADMFLVSTYVAVPVSYVGSVGGATSHLQVDVTGNLHAGDGPLDGWIEGGLGAMALPTVLSDWDFAFGPVVGIGADLGPVRLGARFLWSPPALHGGSRVRGTVFSSAATISVATR